MPINSPELRPVNSVSYADVAGLQLGLERLAGEDTHTYVDRLYRAANARRDHSCQGTINELALHFGLTVRPGIRITSLDTESNISCSIAGVRLVHGQSDVTYPLFDIAPDGVWVWRKLSDIVAAVNAGNTFSAELLTDDGPALQICRQSNVNIAVNESIAGLRVQLQYPQVIASSVRFNQPVPTNSISGSTGLLSFTAEPPKDLTVSYQYRLLPFDLVCSQVGLIGLLDAGLNTAAVQNGVLAYQAREALQVIMQADRSYWAR